MKTRLFILLSILCCVSCNSQKRHEKQQLLLDKAFVEEDLKRLSKDRVKVYCNTIGTYQNWDNSYHYTLRDKQGNYIGEYVDYGFTTYPGSENSASYGVIQRLIRDSLEKIDLRLKELE